MLKDQFKTRDALCTWLQEHKPLLEHEVGIKFSQLEIANNLLIGTPKDIPDRKVILALDFDFSEKSLKAVEATLEKGLEDGKYIGAIMLAESFTEDIWEYMQTLKNYVRLVYPLYLQVDEDNKPVFDYPKMGDYPKELIK